MDVKEAIEKRASVRDYSDKPVSEEDLKELIDAARKAPSGHNAQPSKYMIIKDEDRPKLKENSIFRQGFVYESPSIIVCCADPDVYGKDDDPMNDQNQKRALRDLSIASSFLVLRATELGLGTCYIGWIEKEKIKDVLNIPKNYVVPFVITIGYPKGSDSMSSKKPIDEVIL